MIKKILSSIILIMIICSGFIHAAYAISPDDNINDSPEQETVVVPEDSKENEDSQDKEIDNKDEATENESVENDNSNNNIDSGNNKDSVDNTTNNKDSNPESNTEQSQEEPQEKPNNNKNEQLTTNNTIQKSSESRLKELKIDVEGLTPKFDKNTTEYYLIVDLSVKKINITAKTIDNSAKWVAYGNKNLKEGENTVTINVTAEDGTKRVYYIHVTKVDNIELANAELEKLEIEGVSLYPTFKSNIFSYNLNINQDISNLNILAIPSNENAVVEVEGNENLQEGENIIKINVTAANGETIRIYKINTYISSDRVEVQEEDKTFAIILMGILGSCIIGLGISIIVKNKK